MNRDLKGVADYIRDNVSPNNRKGTTVGFRATDGSASR